MTLFEVAKEISRRLTATFLRDGNGRRPVYGGCEKFQNDPHWRDYILFYEYFHGDNGAGLGASHQTGWTGHRRAADGPVRPDGRERRCSPPRRSGSPSAWCANRSAARPEHGHDHAALSVAVPDQHPRPPVGAERHARPAGDARRRARCGAGSARARRLRLRLVPRRVADGRGRTPGVGIQPRVAGRVPPRAARLPGRGRDRVLLRGQGLPRARRLRRRRGARATARPPASATGSG